MESDGQTPNEFKAFWGGNKVFDQVDISSQGYTYYSYTETATTTSTTVQFGFQNDPGWLQLDDVSVTHIVSGATATFTTTATQLSGGTHTITASYSGDTNFSDSSGSVLQTVHAASTYTSVSSSSNSSVFGQSVTFTATCSGQWSVVSGQWPTGTVTFSDGGTSLGTASLTFSTSVAQLMIGDNYFPPQRQLPLSP